MATYLVFGRREYPQPLVQLAAVEADAPPDLADLGVGDGWLELQVVAHDDVIWVLRDGALAVDWAELTR